MYRHEVETPLPSFQCVAESNVCVKLIVVVYSSHHSMRVQSVDLENFGSTDVVMLAVSTAARSVLQIEHSTLCILPETELLAVLHRSGWFERISLNLKTSALRDALSNCACRPNGCMHSSGHQTKVDV